MQEALTLRFSKIRNSPTQFLVMQAIAKIFDHWLVRLHLCVTSESTFEFP